jgi:Zn-finger nucleic acid-binding protein
MKCPVDKDDMMVVESRRIELDFCLCCSGVWFDAQELDLLISAVSKEYQEEPQNDLLTPKPAEVNEGHRKCPICGKKMNKVWLGKEPKVLIDSCPRGDGLWFDGGELHEVIHQIKNDGKDDILSFLSETFKAQHATDSHK